jgi:hypothetical protein
VPGPSSRSRTGIRAPAIKIEPGSEVESAALEAALAEDAGELAAAQRLWYEVKEKDRPDKDTGQRPWGLLADRHLRELKEVEAREWELVQYIDRQGNLVPEFKPRSDAERQAAEALRSQLFKEPAAVRELWSKLKKQYEGQREYRVWVLLAAWKARELADKK